MIQNLKTVLIVLLASIIQVKSGLKIIDTSTFKNVSDHVQTGSNLTYTLRIEGLNATYISDIKLVKYLPTDHIVTTKFWTGAGAKLNQQPFTISVGEKVGNDVNVTTNGRYSVKMTKISTKIDIIFKIRNVEPEDSIKLGMVLVINKTDYDIFRSQKNLFVFDKNVNITLKSEKPLKIVNGVPNGKVTVSVPKHYFKANIMVYTNKNNDITANFVSKDTSGKAHCVNDGMFCEKYYISSLTTKSKMNLARGKAKMYCLLIRPGGIQVKSNEIAYEVSGGTTTKSPGGAATRITISLFCISYIFFVKIF